MNDKTLNQKTENLELKALKMAGYQRSTNTRQVNRIAREFDEAKLGFLVASHRDGQYYLLDGAHRAAALRKLGYSHAKCIILEGMTYEREAEYFRTQNANRRPLSQYNLYVAGLEAKEESYVKIDAVLKVNGFEIGTQSRNFGIINAFHALKTVAENYGYETLDATLRLIRKTWEGVLLATNREFIVGVAEFISRFGAADFANRLGQKPVGAIWQDYLMIIGRHASRPSDNPDMRKIFCSVLVNHYNKGLSSKSRQRLKLEGFK